ncbi:MAG: MoxR family ATPase, partial [Henriciella sp.]
IVQARVPDVSSDLLKQLVNFVHSLRDMDIRKRPSISETVDWARTLLLMHASELDEDMVRTTLNVLLKHESDIQAVDKELRKLTRDSVAGQ